MISKAMMLKILSVSLIETLFCEIGFAVFWGIRGKRNYRIIVLANILTNPIVVSAYYAVRIHRLQLNYGLITIGLELFAFLAEGIIYKRNQVARDRSFLFSLSANAFSYAVGQLLNQI